MKGSVPKVLGGALGVEPHGVVLRHLGVGLGGLGLLGFTRDWD